MKFSAKTNRREFIKASLLGGTAAVAGWRIPGACFASSGPSGGRPRVALTAGNDRIDNILRGLHMFRNEIAAAIGSRRVILKPNVVIGMSSPTKGDLLLSTTSVDALAAILEFLKSIGKTNVSIAESTATDPTAVGFQNCGYYGLANQYSVKFMDLNQEGYEVMSVWKDKKQDQLVRISKVLLNPDNFIISAAKIKTHNNVVLTLSLKNVVMASPIVDVGYFSSQPGANYDKPIMHGLNNQDLNDNIYLLAPRLAPDLAVIDGFQGMEGNGPCWGTPVDHRVAIVSADWLAADRVGVELMGVNPAWPAYLNYCAQKGYGQYGLASIDVIGEKVENHIINYKMHDNIATQLANIRLYPRT